MLAGIKKMIKSKFQVKIPVYVPVMYGSLLKNRTALITGGTRGIGFCIAKAFVRNGATVVLTGRNQERIRLACAELKKIDAEAEVYGSILDVSDIDAMEIRFKAIVEQLRGKQIDILVNNAGIINQTGFEDADADEFDEVIRTDLKGPYFLSRMISNYMLNNGIQGNILNISSSSALRPTTTSYGLAKWGIRGFTAGLAKKLSKNNIVVNGLAPGPTATEMLVDPQNGNLARESSPSGRMTDPEEIGNIAVVLVSSMGRMINGDTVYVTGGCGNLTLDDW